MKKILYLGVKKKKILDYFNKHKLKFDYFENIDESQINSKNYKFIICYRYKNILSKKIVSNFKKKIINCHSSFLPWNRGSYPNFWSFFYDTPKGVTIHYINEHIDTGEIILQKNINLKITNNTTLKNTYKILDKNLEDLLVANFDEILKNKIKCTKQDITGTFYNKSDLKKFKKFLKKGWNTKVKSIENRGYEFF